MKKWLCRILLPYIARLENKMWKVVYLRDKIEDHLPPHKDMFK